MGVYGHGPDSVRSPSVTAAEPPNVAPSLTANSPARHYRGHVN